MGDGNGQIWSMIKAWIIIGELRKTDSRRVQIFFRHGRIHFLAGIISITFGLYVLLKQPIPRNVQELPVITWPKRSWILSGCFVHRWRFTIFPVYRWVVHNSQIGVKNKNMFILFRANSWRSILTDEYDSMNGSKNNNLRQIVDNFLYQTDSKTWTYRV